MTPTAEIQLVLNATYSRNLQLAIWISARVSKAIQDYANVLQCPSETDPQQD
jgi:hypothetical protein